MIKWTLLIGWRCSLLTSKTVCRRPPLWATPATTSPGRSPGLAFNLSVTFSSVRWCRTPSSPSSFKTVRNWETFTPTTVPTCTTQTWWVHYESRQSILRQFFNRQRRYPLRMPAPGWGCSVSTFTRLHISLSSHSTPSWTRVPTSNSLATSPGQFKYNEEC